eukprot:103448-Chlamydomonas_euryale.AAC.1
MPQGIAETRTGCVWTMHAARLRPPHSILPSPARPSRVHPQHYLITSSPKPLPLPSACPLGA